MVVGSSWSARKVGQVESSTVAAVVCRLSAVEGGGVLMSLLTTHTRSRCLVAFILLQSSSSDPGRS